MINPRHYFVMNAKDALGRLKRILGHRAEKCDLIVDLSMGSEATGRVSNAHNRFS